MSRAAPAAARISGLITQRRRLHHISNSITSSGTMIDSTGRDQRLGQHRGKVVD